METEYLKMNNLTISKTQAAEVPFLVAMESNIENSVFIFPNSQEEHLQLILAKDIAHLTIKSEQNEIIGFVILAGLNNPNKSIEFRRIVIEPKGKGWGRKTVQEIKKYSFETLKCHRLWLDVLEDNARARYLYQSEGFKEEGTLREAIYVDGKFKSLIIMSILVHEFKG